jgi:hypothetical protein
MFDFKIDCMMKMNMSHDSSVCNISGPRSDSWDSLLPTVLVLNHNLQILPTATVFNIQHSSINSVNQLGNSSTYTFMFILQKKQNYKYLTAKYLGQYSNLTKINYLSFRSCDSCHCLLEPKHHSFLFNH